MYYNEKKIRIVEVVWFLDINDLNFCINRSATQPWVYGSYLIRAADIMRWCDLILHVAPIAEIIKFQIPVCCTDMYLIWFLPNFVAFCMFLWISLIYLNFAAPQPCELSEALYSGLRSPGRSYSTYFKFVPMDWKIINSFCSLFTTATISPKQPNLQLVWLYSAVFNLCYENSRLNFRATQRLP